MSRVLRRVRPRFTPVDCLGGSDSAGTLRVASGARGAVSQRGLHAHRACQFLHAEVTGAKMPSDIKSADMEKTVMAKGEVIDWLKRSHTAVKTAHAGVKPADLQRKGRGAGWHVLADHRPRVFPDERPCAALVEDRRRVTQIAIIPR